MFLRTNLIILKICLLVSFLNSQEIFISNERTQEGNGTLLNPYVTIVKGIQENQSNNTNLTVYLISTEIAYIIDNISEIKTNLIIKNYKEFEAFPFIEFRNEGSFVVNGNFSLRLENIRFRVADNLIKNDLIVFSIKNSLNFAFHNCEFSDFSSYEKLYFEVTNTYFIGFSNSNFSSLILENVNFLNFTACDSIQFENCNFNDISAKNAYLIYTFKSKMLIKNCLFANNTLEKTLDTQISIIRSGSEFHLSTTLFKGNLLKSSTVLLIENDFSNQIIVNISTISFEANKATSNEILALNINGKDIKVFAANINFLENIAPQSLISISNTLNFLEITTLNLINNFGNSLISLNLIENITISSINCILSNKKTASTSIPDEISMIPGNCLSIINYKDLIVKDSLFSNNFAISTLSGILLEHTSEINLFDLIDNSDLSAFFNNIECSYNEVNTSEKNLSKSGNCIYLDNFGSITLINSNFTSNINNPFSNAKYSGNPCLSSHSFANNLYIYSSLFKNNQAYSESSCLNFYGTEIIIKNSSFIENRSMRRGLPESFYIGNEGGALSLGARNVTIGDILIYNCSAMKGAGIFFHNRYSKPFQNLYAQNMTISKNEGVQTSGMEFDSTLILGDYYFINCSFTKNKVEFYGVISSFYYTSFNLYFYFNEISYNWGISAGAAFSFCHFGGNIFINDTIFVGNVLNQTTFVGGATMFLYGFSTTTLVFVKGCTFIENQCSLKGGAIQATYGQIYIKDSIFIDNYAPIGGAVSVSVFCPGKVENSTIKSKYKSNQGGGIHVQNFAKVSIVNTIFIDCQANQGGGIYVSGNQMNFYYLNVSFYNVKAEDGAAISIENHDSPQIFLNNIYIENSESTLSSLLYFDSNYLAIFNLTITQSRGRSFFISNSTLNLIDVSIQNHLCEAENNLGCIMFAQKVNNIEILNIFIRNATSYYEEDGFSLTTSKVLLVNLTINDFNSNSETLIMKASQSFIILMNSIFTNLNNSLINIISSEMQILNCEFHNISSQTNYGIIKNEFSLAFSITNSYFDFIYGKSGGALSILSSTSNFKTTLSNVTFENCVADNGAAVYLMGQNINISFCAFTNNLAKIAGGAIYFDCIEEKNYKWLLFNSNFSNNSATKGGAYHSNRYIPKYSSCTFFNNTALYGKDFSGFPLKLSLESNGTLLDCDQDPTHCYLRKNITSGQTVPPIIISVLDYYNQKMIFEDSVAFVKLATYEEKINEFQNFSENLAPYRDKVLFEGVEIQKLSNGSFNYSEIVITSEPPSNAWISINTDCIPAFYSEFLPNNSYFHKKNPKTNSYYYNIKIFLRDCIPGEIYSSDKSKCIPCSKGKYSFFTSNKNCRICPREAHCDGGTSLKLDPGYWRASNISEEIYQCNIFTESCLGGTDSACLNGYTGVLCGACEYNQQKKFFKKALFYCEECQNVWIYILIVIGVIFLIILFIFYLISSKKGANIENFVLVKIVMNHIQTISFLSNIKVEFPSFLNGFTGVQAPVSSMDSVVFTIECFKDSINLSNFEMKLISSLVIMCGVIAFLIAFYTAYGIYKNKNKEFILENIFNALVIVGSFFQPSFINFYIQNLSCDLIAGKSYLTYNLEQECWDKTYTLYAILLIFPLLFFWMIIFPAIFLIYMYLNRKNLRNPKVFQITKFFQAGYKEKCFYWEFVNMSRKFMVILLTTFLRNDPSSVIYIIIPVISFYLTIQIIVMPYHISNSFKFNTLEILSLFACFITYYFAVFYLKNFSQNQRTFFLIVILSFNFVFFVVWTKHYLFYLKGRITNLLNSFSFKSRSKDLRTKKTIEIKPVILNRLKFKK